MRIKVQGDNVQTWLNGQEMVNLNDEKIGAGKAASPFRFTTVEASRFFGVI